MRYTKNPTLIAVLALLLTGCGGSEYETGRTYHVTVRHGDAEAIYLVEGENITRNANGSWVLRNAKKTFPNSGMAFHLIDSYPKAGTVRIPAAATVTVRLRP